eukprot:366555-Chlamydomonas_euryale.AAC.16
MAPLMLVQSPRRRRARLASRCAATAEVPQPPARDPAGRPPDCLGQVPPHRLRVRGSNSSCRDR